MNHWTKDSRYLLSFEIHVFATNDYMDFVFPKFNNKLRLLLGCCCCMYVLTGFSQNVSSYSIQGIVQDAVTRLPIEGFTDVDLLGKDSVSVFTTGFLSDYPDKSGRNVTHLSLPVKQSGEYVIRLRNNNYHTLYHPITIVLHQREEIINVGTLLLKRRLVSESYDLDEVTVTATKIKFYFDEDTLVYDAAQYITQEGLALNDILRKMPGVEINDKGEIFSNGRKIEYLLLNGKDFFNKDRKTILANLPAFMVKDVKIYQREIDSLAVLDREKMMTGLTMDVRLKKDYQVASMANVDAGGGNDSKYYGKLFGMGFSQFHRMSIYAIANNINRNDELDINGNVGRNLDNGYGDKKLTTTGIDYNVDDRQGKYELEGDVRFQFSNVMQTQKDKQQLFFIGGNQFSEASNTMQNESLSFSSKHKLYLFAKSLYSLTLSPSITHSSLKKQFSATDAMFITDIDTICGNSWMDFTNLINDSSLLNQYGTRKTCNEILGNYNSTEASIGIEKSVNIPRTNDVLHLSANVSYANNMSNGFSQWNSTFFKYGTKQWTYAYEKYLSSRYGSTIQSDYTYKISSTKNLLICYSYTHNAEDSDSPIYSLHLMNGQEDLPFGSIPDDNLLSTVKDSRNSTCFTQNENIHQMRAAYLYDKISYENENRREEKLNISIPLTNEIRNMHVKQGVLDTTAIQSRMLPELSAEYSLEKFHMRDQHGFWLRLSYKYKEKLPAIIQTIDLRNDAIPTQIRCGNPNLKPSSYHYPYVQFMIKPSSQSDHSIAYEELFSVHEVVNALLYDKDTGVYLSKPMNADGNRVAYYTLRSNFYTNKNLSSKISNYLNVTRNNSVSYIGTTEESLEKPQHICTYEIGDKLTYERKSNDNKRRYEINAFYEHYFSATHNSDYESASMFHYGMIVSSNIELPHDYRTTIEFWGQNRTGHLYSKMNGAEHILNLSLTKAFSNNILLQLEGLDLLGQRKNYIRTITAQSRVEQETNILGRYVMLHFIWRVNSKPKSGQVLSHEHTHEHNH